MVSTAGVFLLDSKHLGGEVSIEGENVHVQMLDDDEDSYDTHVATAVRGMAVRLKEDIEQTGISDVKAVVVFWNPFPAGVASGHRVVYLHGNRLAGWLRKSQRSRRRWSPVSSPGLSRRARARPAPGGNGWRRSAFDARGQPLSR